MKQARQEYLDIAIRSAIDAGSATLKFYSEETEVIYKDDNSPLTRADLESNRVINDYLNKTGIPVLSEENRMIPYSSRSAWNRFWLVDPLDGTKEFINKSSEYTVNIALIENNIPVLGVVYVPVMSLLYFGTEETGSFKVSIDAQSDLNTIQRNPEKIHTGSIHKKLIVVASKSHLNEETEQFIAKLESVKGECEKRSFGSSLKLCMVAEGSADVYPRLGPTMEWDTAASHAVARFAGCKIIRLPDKKDLQYNKQDLLNPYFLVYNRLLDPEIMRII
ncbi:MAG: 3'(2'),5'-bisphosphate nucleotidase CysQ [Bacteroidales bacterium]|jgi:3'(2'), 5'-bisphosphate nucleotidase